MYPLVIIGIIVTIIITIPITYGADVGTTTTKTTTTTTTVQASKPVASSDPSCANIPTAWAATYNHQRFKDYTPDCITVKGTVLSVEPPSTPAGDHDGDYHFNILADIPTYSNSNNCKAPVPGGCKELIAEIVCYQHSAITLHAAQVSCNGYQNHIPGPSKGQQVTITGKWAEDVGVPGDYHKWNEIHPVTNIK